MNRQGRNLTDQLLMLQRLAGNRAVTRYVQSHPAVQRQERGSLELHTLHELHASAEREADSWDPMVRSVHGLPSLGDYTHTVLQTGTFFGQTVAQLHPDLISALQQVEANLKSTHGADYKAPTIDSGYRWHKGMHGWGMAVDFDVKENPYVLNESGEAALDQELKPAYDRIAEFMLGDAQSSLRKLKQGRKGFGGGSVGEVYDALNRESGAMKRYFALKDDSAALSEFLANEWPARHPGMTTPDAGAVRIQMENDYEILGGAGSDKKKRAAPAGTDRPFAPTSGNGVGDPRTGFLNLPKEFVLAMTDAGLAWGAVDIQGEPGDVQHFDLRLAGQGKKAYDELVRPKAAKK